MSKNTNKYRPEPERVAGRDTVANPLAALFSAVGELPESGTYALTVDTDLVTYTLAPQIGATLPPAILPVAKQADIVVYCERTRKRCVATHEVKRAETGEVKLVCRDCVGPAHENAYQKTL